MKALVFTLFIFSLPMISSAGLGESRAQITAKYGPGEDSTSGMVFFDKDGLKVSAGFYQGKCVIISFFRQEPRLSEQEIDALMEAHQGTEAKAWTKKKEEGKSGYRWKTADDAFEAGSGAGIFWIRDNAGYSDWINVLDSEGKGK